MAGSVLKLNEAVRNIYENTNYDLNHVVNMASINQARVLGLEDKIGSIEYGKIADLIIFDEDINIVKVIIDGEVYWNNEDDIKF